MSKHHNNTTEPENGTKAAKADENTENAEAAAQEAAAESGEAAPETELSAEEKLQKELDEAKAAVEKEKKEYLFLVAEFDNYRKRVLKEKAELLKNGAEKAMRELLPVVDDFERGLAATKDSEDAAGVREGMELIYNKFVKYLADNGVKEMDTKPGSDFNADLHEAIATFPAPADDLKGKIIDTTQKGYTLNDEKVLRHAKVVVGE